MCSNRVSSNRRLLTLRLICSGACSSLARKPRTSAAGYLPGCLVNLGDQIDVGHVGRAAMLRQQHIAPPTGPRRQGRLQVAGLAAQRLSVGQAIDRALPRQTASVDQAARPVFPDLTVGQPLDAQPMRPWLSRASRSACFGLASQRSTSACLDLLQRQRAELDRLAAGDDGGQRANRAARWSAPAGPAAAAPPGF